MSSMHTEMSPYERMTESQKDLYKTAFCYPTSYQGISEQRATLYEKHLKNLSWKLLETGGLARYGYVHDTAASRSVSPDDF